MCSHFSVNEVRSHVVFYSKKECFLRTLSTIPAEIQYAHSFSSIEDIRQIELYEKSNLLFIRRTSGFLVWDMKKSEIVFRQAVPDLQEICVSKMYFVACTLNQVLFYDIKNFTIKFTHELVPSYQFGCCSIDFWNSRTVCAFQKKEGTVSVWKENKIAHIKTGILKKKHIHASQKMNKLVVLDDSCITLYSLYGLNKLRYITTPGLVQFRLSCFTNNHCYVTDINSMTMCFDYLNEETTFGIFHDRGTYIMGQEQLFFVTTTGIITACNIKKRQIKK